MSPTVTSNGTTRAASPLPATPALASSAQRNRSRVAAGALILVACTLAAVVIYGRVGDRRAVLAMARGVEVGQTLQASDLRVVHVSTEPGLDTIPATGRSRVVGQPAAVRLVPGSLLSPAEIGGGAALPDGMALVGAILKPGQFPLGLAPGDTVALVAAPASGAGLAVTADSPAEPPTAIVVAVERATDATGNTAVSLQLPAKAASLIAGAGAAGRLNLVVVGR
ncbi:MAG: SAF domain-containing protein [Acidimicrobiia bacterium]